MSKTDDENRPKKSPIAWRLSAAMEFLFIPTQRPAFRAAPSPSCARLRKTPHTEKAQP
jgi:hypothetical protein